MRVYVWFRGIATRTKFGSSGSGCGLPQAALCFVSPVAVFFLPGIGFFGALRGDDARDERYGSLLGFSGCLSVRVPFAFRAAATTTTTPI